MALNIDISRTLRRPSDLVRLVEAVVAGLAEDEADWIEWKSTLDLRTIEGQFTVAKHILGLANRTPGQAVRFVEGLGYIIVGAEPGSVAGVVPIDPAKVDDGLSKYLGNPGPMWSPSYVEVQGQSVVTPLRHPR